MICGQNDGLHMYVEAGRDSGNEVQLINTFTGTGSRTFKIKVSQIECGQDWSPRHGCTQYFTGASGTFTSYNYQQRRHLNDQIVR